MDDALYLELTDYEDDAHWRWVLNDANGRYLADHDVDLADGGRYLRGFRDLTDYLDYYSMAFGAPAGQLAELGAWIGENVFDRLRPILAQRLQPPATVVHVRVPPAAQDLLFRPLELARFPDGRSFVDAGLRFVYQLDEPAAYRPGKQTGDAVRLLAVFSLPDRASPLNLRRQRYQLARLVRRLQQTRSAAVELRVLQYGATRETLRRALEEAAGWDVVHLSGHGRRGTLLLEDDAGGLDEIAAEDLAGLLRPGSRRLKLLILDACYSGAASHAAARAQVGLDGEPLRQDDGGREDGGRETGGHEPAPDEPDEEEGARPTALPSLAQELAAALDCAALAMRYPVGDAFATDLTLALYDRLLDKGQPLPAALQLALDEALEGNGRRPPLSPVTPILFGPRAAGLQLALPSRPAEFTLPRTGLINFPPEPPRFVGRVRPLLRASQALAPGSQRRGVLFYGMPGAGKTACALELAYRHERDRFQGQVWYQAPEEGQAIGQELFNLLFEIERQLNAPNLGLTASLDDPDQWRAFILPRLRALLQQHAILLVLDNVESLLTASDNWRDARWGDLLEALLGHDGASRVVLTSRRPAALANDPRLHQEAIHALSFAESVLLARELPHLRRLFEDAEGRGLLRRALRLAQGHPKLLELADGLAEDRAALARQLDAAEEEAAAESRVLEAFFAPRPDDPDHEGESQQPEAAFVATLQRWTRDVAGRLSPGARLLFTFLCRLEPADRTLGIVQPVWPDFLERSGRSAETSGDVPSLLEELEAASLAAVERAEGADGDGPATIAIHPGVAETELDAAGDELLAAADEEIGDYWVAVFRRALETEMEGQSQLVAESGRRAAPYLLRRERWEHASTLLENMLLRDSSPATLAFAIPLLRRIVDETAGTERALIDAGVLAMALWQAGRTAEAEQMERDRIKECVAQGNYRLASVAAANLFNLLHAAGRYEEALAAAEEKAEYTRRAGLGPWTQLGDEGMRLQALNAVGEYGEVLARVKALRPQLEELPLEGDAEEAVNPWNVRETLLDTGRSAAMRSERWRAALALNAEIVRYQERRGADALEVARTRFNDYGPLQHLDRLEDARHLLDGCRAVFEAERYVAGLGNVYIAFAILENRAGDRPAAVGFAETALRYRYRAGNPEECAISHNNLANYLARDREDAGLVLAHRLAAALIRVQISSGLLPTTLINLASSELPSAPPPFAEVVARVEQISGVRFGELAQRLAGYTGRSSEEALAQVWQLVQQEREKREQLLTALPPELVQALAGDDEERFEEWLDQLSPEEREALEARLAEAARQAGVSTPQQAGPDMEEVLKALEPLLQAVAAVARGEEGELSGAEIAELLPQLEEKGWMLREPVKRIWAGEREEATLTVGLDPNSARLVRRLLAILAGR